MAFKPIEILINAKDNASSVFDGLNGKLKVIGAAIAGYFGIKAFAGIVQGAADLEQGMSRVQAATGASADEMAKLRKAAEDAGANTKYTSTEAAGALETLAKAGLNATDAIATLPAVLNLAQAGDIGLAEASEYVTKAVMGMGLAFSDAGRVADVLALGANATNTSVTGLAQALSYAAPIAQSAGVSLEGTVAIMGKLADAGIDASRSGTAVANMLAQFSDPSSAFKRELAAAGIVTNDFEKALHQLADAGPRGEKAILAVGLNAGPALRALLNQGMPALDELKAKLDGAAGSAAATAKIMEDNLNGSFKGLASAWDAVKNTLGAPVLPVLKDGVDQLAGAFRSAVSDGTIGKFGDAIATAFQAGIKWVREFVAQVDFTQVTADMRAFADRAGEIFTQIGDYATNAGNIVKLGYGVMSSGAYAVLGVVYLVGEAFAKLAGNIQEGVALIMRGFAKVTFGSISAGFKEAAAEMELSADATRAAADELGKKSTDAFLRVADGAQTARDGFAGLAKSATDASPAIDGSSRAMAAVAKELTAGAEAAVAAGLAFAKKANADQVAKKSADDHSAAVAQLKKEYGDLVASGNLQGAAEKLREINKALSDTPNSAKDAVDAAKAVSDAFTRLGVTSSADLKAQADNAKRDYELIKNAGTSTAEDIAKAFEKAVEAAIAANKGIAPPWVEGQAAAKGYEVAVDAAGKATVRAATQGQSVVQGLGASWGSASAELVKYTVAMDKMAQRYGGGEKANASRYGRPGDDAAAQADERTKRLSGQNAVDNTLMFKLRDKGSNLTAADIPDLEAVLAAERKNDKMINNRLGGRAGVYSLDGLADDSNWRQIKAQWQSFLDGQKNLAEQPADAMGKQGANQPPQAAPGNAYVTNITLEDGSKKSFRMADSESQSAVNDLIRQLAQARSTAGRR